MFSVRLAKSLPISRIAMQSKRSLSSQGDAAVAKLRTLMEEYRTQK